MTPYANYVKAAQVKYAKPSKDTTTDSARMNPLRSGGQAPITGVTPPGNTVEPMAVRRNPDETEGEFAARVEAMRLPPNRAPSPRPRPTAAQIAIEQSQHQNAKDQAAAVARAEEERKAQEAAAKANKPTATPDRSMLQYLVNPTDNQYANYGIAGGMGALALGGLGGLLFSEPKNRLRNTLLYALLGGGLGLGAKYLADRYGVGAAPAAPSNPTTTA